MNFHLREMLFNIQKSIMRNKKIIPNEINNKHFNAKFIIINTINKLIVLFLFDDFYSCRYPLLQYEDIAPMRRLLAARRTAPDPTGWAGQRAPHGKERHHASVRPDPHRRSPGPYIHTGPEPPGRSKPRQSSRTRRALVCAGIRCRHVCGHCSPLPAQAETCCSWPMT